MNMIIPTFIKLCTVWRETLVLLKFGKMMTEPKIRQIFTIQIFTHVAIESHVNIEQIGWKIFLRYVPNNLQLGYHRSSLDSQAMACV